MEYPLQVFCKLFVKCKSGCAVSTLVLKKLCTDKGLQVYRPWGLAHQLGAKYLVLWSSR